MQRFYTELKTFKKIMELIKHNNTKNNKKYVIIISKTNKLSCHRKLNIEYRKIDFNSRWLAKWLDRLGVNNIISIIHFNVT